MKFNKLIAFCVIITLISCKKNIDAGSGSTINAKTSLNVSYGADPLQNMDIYLPAGRSIDSTKTLIFIHGGAWNSGDKTDLSQYVDTFKRRQPSFAIFNVNYRLASTTSTLFPTQENDIKTAVQFIINNAPSYLISSKIVIMGVSAGGQLALLEAYKNMPVKAKAVISFFGPTDMTDMFNNPVNPYVPLGLIQVIGYTPSQNPSLYASSSPINFVTPQVPPTLLLHGGLDNLVSPAQATTLQDKLQQAGVVNQYIYYPTEGHGWFGANLTDSFNKIDAFLAANVK